MTSQHPIILYAGNAERADMLRQVVKPIGWHVLDADETLDALGCYLFDHPDRVVIEDNPVGRDIFAHLRSVGATGIFVLTDTPQYWGMSTDEEAWALPDVISSGALASAIGAYQDPPLRNAS